MVTLQRYMVMYHSLTVIRERKRRISATLMSKAEPAASGVRRAGWCYMQSNPN